MLVDDTCFPPSYTPTERQGKLIEWARFAVQYNPYFLNDLDSITVEVVLVLESIYAAPHSGLILSIMERKFPKVISLLGRSHYRSNYFEGKMLKREAHPFNRINNGYCKEPLMLSQEYATAIINKLIQNGVIIKEEVPDEKKNLLFGYF